MIDDPGLPPELPTPKAGGHPLIDVQPGRPESRVPEGSHGVDPLFLFPVEPPADIANGPSLSSGVSGGNGVEPLPPPAADLVGRLIKASNDVAGQLRQLDHAKIELHRELAHLQELLQTV